MPIINIRSKKKRRSRKGRNIGVVQSLLWLVESPVPDVEVGLNGGRALELSVLICPSRELARIEWRTGRDSRQTERRRISSTDTNLGPPMVRPASDLRPRGPATLKDRIHTFVSFSRIEHGPGPIDYDIANSSVEHDVNVPHDEIHQTATIERLFFS